MSRANCTEDIQALIPRTLISAFATQAPLQTSPLVTTTQSSSTMHVWS
jgi:hypothetical protein